MCCIAILLNRIAKIFESASQPEAQSPFRERGSSVGAEVDAGDVYSFEGLGDHARHAKMLAEQFHHSAII